MSSSGMLHRIWWKDCDSCGQVREYRNTIVSIKIWAIENKYLFSLVFYRICYCAVGRSSKDWTECEAGNDTSSNWFRTSMLCATFKSFNRQCSSSSISNKIESTTEHLKLFSSCAQANAIFNTNAVRQVILWMWGGEMWTLKVHGNLHPSEKHAAELWEEFHS